MNANELFEKKSIFWSRLGFENDPPRYDEHGKLIEFRQSYEKFAELHRKMHDTGIKLHTSILFSGWVGPDTYDYTLTDDTLDALFAAVPDALYIPRVKLNAPVEWQKRHPEELFVYWGGNNDPEYIRSKVATPEHDLLGDNSPNGYWLDKRPNMNGFFCNQSYASDIWLRDAKKALAALLQHIAEKAYAKQIIGYHIGYGGCGETCLWGRCSGHYGDYSRVFEQAFRSWGEQRYGGKDACLKAWGTDQLPDPDMRRKTYSGLDAFLRQREEDRITIDLDRYVSERNATLAEELCGIVKRENPQLYTGIFYGYILECFNANYSGWLNIEQILNSPVIDFIAAPCSYFRRAAGESGGSLTPAASINRKKIFLDELDIRTYLAKNAGNLGIAKPFTRAVLCREAAKNLASGSGFWWMDLGGYWYDSDFMQEEIRYVEKLASEVRALKGQSKADILELVSEESFLLHTESEDLFNRHRHFEREMGLSGVIFDIYRLSDLPELDLSRYKMIVLKDCVSISLEQRKILDRFPGVQLSSYLDGMVEKKSASGIAFVESNEKFPKGKVTFSGIFAGEVEFDGSPLPRIVPLAEPVEVYARFADGSPVLLSSDGKRFHSILPVMTWRQIRSLAEYAQCRTFGKAPCVVYGNSAFTAVFQHEEPEKFTFKIHKE